MSTDAIVLLKKDHQEMRKLFREFEKAGERRDRHQGAAGDSDHRGADRAHLHRERSDVPACP